MSKRKAAPSSSRHKKEKFNITTQTNKIYNYMSHGKDISGSNEDEDPYFGDKHTYKPEDTIRVWYTNPCGLGLDHHHPKSDDSFNFLQHQSQADIFGLAETNVRWDKLYHNSSLYSRVKQRWKFFKISTSQNAHANLGVAQRGGTCTVSHGQAAYRVHNRGEDESGLGRWSWLEFRGRDNHLTRVYTAYRPGGPPSSRRRSYTTVYEQQIAYLKQNKIDMQPRDYFDASIMEELSKILQTTNVILLIDVNQDVIRGHFTRKMKELGLSNVFETKSSDTFPIPPTHHRGSKPISAIYVNGALDCTRCGILPKCVGIHGDHRNMFADFTTHSFLGSCMYDVISQPMKRLQLKDPRTVNKFVTIVRKHLHSTSSFQYAEMLFSKATYPPPLGLHDDMEKLDDQLGRAISAGKKKCRHLFVGNIPYSDTFETLRDTRRLWLLVRKRKIGQKISSKTIQRLAKKLNIQKPLSYPLLMVDSLRNGADRQYRTLSKQTAKERRLQFLQDLAAAHASSLQKDKEKILIRIIHEEQARNQSVMTRRYFPKKGTSEQRVDRVQYKEGDAWVEATHPQTVLNACQEDTRRKYNDTGGTPLMEEEVNKLFGNFAETNYARNMQAHRNEIPSFLDSHTKQMLQQILFDKAIPRLSKAMSEEDVKKAWSLVKEQKAAAPSGRYNGAYKALCMHTDLLKFLTISMNLPFLTGTTYSRWHKMIDIMIFKKANNLKVNNIRSVIISEGDWNTAGKIYVTKRLMQQAEKLHLLPSEHIGGRKGRKATDGALTKRLILDNAKIYRRSMAIVSTDAANCYDRMTHKFISFICVKWGLAIQVMISLLAPLQTARHHTRTAYGDSTQFFQGVNLQGAGQGNTSAAPFWTSISTPIIHLLKQNGSHSSFITPLSGIVVTLALIAFVDDTELFIMNQEDDLSRLVQQAEVTLHLWRAYLYVTGGAMRPSKCSWTLLSYDDSVRSKDILLDNVCPESVISIPDDSGVMQPIPRLDVNTPKEYLGVLQPATCCDKPQLEKMHEKVEEWNNLIQQSRLPPALNLQALFLKIHRTLLYPLPTTAISDKDLQLVSNKLYWKSLPKCGIVRTFPIRYRHLPVHYQGLGLPDLYLEQELSKLREILSFSYTDSILWKQMRLGIEGLQFQIGSQGMVFNYSYYDYGFLAGDTWLKSHWKFVSDYNFSFQGWKDIQPLRRARDIFLMEAFVQFGSITQKDLIILNECRQYLQVWCLSDIVDITGTYITQEAHNGRRDPARVSLHKSWPKFRRPNVNHWIKWQHWLKMVFCTPLQERRLATPLGVWLISPPFKWQWYFHVDSKRLYRIQDRHVKEYIMVDSRYTRSSNCWFRFRSIIKDVEIIPHRFDMALATVNSIVQGGFKVCCDGYRMLPPVPRISLPPTAFNLEELLKEDPDFPSWAYCSGNFDTVTIETFQNIMDQPFRFVTDASYDCGHGTAAAIFEPISKQYQLIFILSVPSNLDNMYSYNDAYRSESAGLLAGLIMIRHWEKKLGRAMNVTCSCDNDRALDFTAEFSYTTTNSQHFDIGKAIIRTKALLTSTLNFEKVEGHVKEKHTDRVLTRVEILNDTCDSLAKSARQTLPPSPPLHFEMEGLSLWHDSRKIYSNFNECIRKIYYDLKAREIIKVKYLWQDYQYDLIDWKALQSASNLLPRASMIRMSKLVTSTLPIGENMELRQEWKESFCPRCHHPVETPSHIFHCPCLRSRKLHKISLMELNLWMIKMHTPELLRLQIIHCVSLWLTENEVPLDDEMLLPIREQTEIGWNHLFEGRVVKSFNTYMTDHYTTNYIQRDGNSWSAVFIQKIWRKFFEAQWTYRNECVHGINRKKSTTREFVNLNAEMKEIYSQENSFTLLQEDRHLMEIPFKDLSLRPVSQKRGWLLSIKAARMARDKYQSAEEQCMSRQMLRFLVPKNGNAKPSESESSPLSPSTPSLERDKTHVVSRPRKLRVNSKRRRQITTAQERWEFKHKRKKKCKK